MNFPGPPEQLPKSLKRGALFIIKTCMQQRHKECDRSNVWDKTVMWGWICRKKKTPKKGFIICWEAGHAALVSNEKEKSWWLWSNSLNVPCEMICRASHYCPWWRCSLCPFSSVTQHFNTVIKNACYLIRRFKDWLLQECNFSVVIINMGAL